MPHIVLTEEQLHVVAQAETPVEVHDPKGNWLGRIDPQEAAMVAEVLRRRGEPRKWIPAEKVKAHLRALQAEWDRTGGFDRPYMLAFLEKLRAEDEQ